MKFIVDELPYCGEPCFFEETRCDANWLNICPRLWEKDKVCGEGRKKCSILLSSLLV